MGAYGGSVPESVMPPVVRLCCLCGAAPAQRGERGGWLAYCGDECGEVARIVYEQERAAEAEGALAATAAAYSVPWPEPVPEGPGVSREVVRLHRAIWAAVTRYTGRAQVPYRARLHPELFDALMCDAEVAQRLEWTGGTPRLALVDLEPDPGLAPDQVVIDCHPPKSAAPLRLTG